jgi:3-oxoacyl-[acyl-carrier-protein] synthase II
MREGDRRVVVTGMGAVTPLGNDVATTWAAMLEGRSGIGPITIFDPARVASKIAGEIRGFDATEVMDRKEVRRNDRYIHYAWAGAIEALRDAGLPNPITDASLSDRTGVIIGSGIGGINTMIRDIVEATVDGIERVGPFLVTAMIIDMAAGFVAIQSGARGPNYATVSACASSNHALGDALTIIRRGDADVMIAGGAEAGIGEIPIAAFSSMRALSTRRNDEPEKACRPFDAERDGFIMADGAGILVLEALEHAQARGATIHAEMIGYAATDDASHITLPAPGGRGAAASMRLAIADAGIEPGEIGYINAHGTSTPANDKAETAAIKTVFGEHARKLAVSSTKSMTGHPLGAAGGIEAGIAALAIDRKVLPPTINYETPDPECDLDYVPNRAREATVDAVLSNSFGFGGTNAALVLTRYKGD